MVAVMQHGNTALMLAMHPYGSVDTVRWLLGDCDVDVDASTVRCLGVSCDAAVDAVTAVLCCHRSRAFGGASAF